MGAALPYRNYYNKGLWCPYLSCVFPEPVDVAAAMGEITDERQTAASSPLAQSDSEGSTSSYDLGSSVAGLAINAAASKESLVKCRWSDCGQWFEHLDLLASHVTRVHAQSGRAGLFYCGWEGCSRGDRGFNARYKMLVHVRTHTNEKPHHCFKCDKSFSRAENLKIHARSHTGERPYVCPIAGCGKAYSNSSDRFKHTRTHSIDKPYVCKVAGCPKRYTDPSSLRKHVKTYRHYPEADKAESVLEVLAREPTPPKVLKRDSTGAAKPSFAERCEEDAAGKESFVDGQGTQYDLFRSWLNADLSVLSRSLPLGLSLWSHPLIGREDYVRPNVRFEAHGVKHSRMDSSSSDDAMDAGIKDQECPLDLTIHRASTRT